MRTNIYWNLHKKTFSVRQKGLVIDHGNQFFLSKARFNVGKAGNAKVRAEGKKNVHATVSGILEPFNEDYIKGTFAYCTDHNPARWATYNPYNNETFVDTVTGKPVYKAELVYLFSRTIDGRDTDKPKIAYWS